MATLSQARYYTGGEWRLFALVTPVRFLFGDLTLTEVLLPFNPFPLAHLFSVGWLDIYSLGIVYYEILTGQLPFVGTKADILLSETPTILTSEQVPAAIKQIIEKCLAKKTEDRYASVGELSTSVADANSPLH